MATRFPQGSGRGGAERAAPSPVTQPKADGRAADAPTAPSTTEAAIGDTPATPRTSRPRAALPPASPDTAPQAGTEGEGKASPSFGDRAANAASNARDGASLVVGFATQAANGVTDAVNRLTRPTTPPPTPEQKDAADEAKRREVEHQRLVDDETAKGDLYRSDFRRRPAEDTRGPYDIRRHHQDAH